MFSRNLHARKHLSRDLQQRFRKANTNSSGKTLTESDKKQLAINYVNDRNKAGTTAYTSPRNERERLVEQFNREQRDRTSKRYKFSPHSNETVEIPDEPTSVCDLFNTGFEDDCNYIQYTGILGPFTILQNFESFDIGDTEEDVYLANVILETEDFESFDIGDTEEDVYLTNVILETEDFESFDEGLYDISDGTLGDMTLAAPDSLTLTTDLELSSIEVTWSDIEGEDNYVVERSDGDDQNYVVLDTLSQNTTSYVDSDNLVLDTTYYYRVKGTNSELDGSYNEISVNYANAFTEGSPYSLEFNPNYIIAPQSPEYSFGTGDFAISMWFYPYSTGSYRTLFEWGRYNDGILVRPHGSSTIQIYINGSSQNIGFNISEATNKWNYFMITRISGQIHVYINSVEVSTYLYSSAIDIDTKQIGFGVSLHSLSQRFRGRIDQIKAWNKGFTLSESDEDKNTVLSGTEPNLILNYKLNEGSGTTATDETGNHDGVIESDTWIAS